VQAVRPACIVDSGDVAAGQLPPAHNFLHIGKFSSCQTFFFRKHNNLGLKIPAE